MNIFDGKTMFKLWEVKNIHFYFFVVTFYIILLHNKLMCIILHSLPKFTIWIFLIEGPFLIFGGSPCWSTSRTYFGSPSCILWLWFFQNDSFFNLFLFFLLYIIMHYLSKFTIKKSQKIPCLWPFKNPSMRS